MEEDSTFGSFTSQKREVLMDIPSNSEETGQANVSDRLTSRRREACLEIPTSGEEIGEARTSDRRPCEAGTIVELLMNVFDDFLLKLDDIFKLHQFERQIVITSNGDYAMPMRFQISLLLILALFGIIWPYVGGIYFTVVMCKTCRARSWRFQHAVVPWSRFLALQLTFILAFVHQIVFLWCMYKIISQCIQQGLRSAFVGNVSVAEAFQPSAVGFLMASTWVLELALLRLEQSATRQLRNELQEYDFSDEATTAATPRLSRIKSGVADLKKTLDGLGAVFYWRESCRCGVKGRNSEDPFHMSFGRNVYYRVFYGDVQLPTSTQSWPGSPLQHTVDGHRLSHQLRCAFTAENSRLFTALMSLCALAQMCVPLFTRLLKQQDFLFKWNWTATDIFIATSFIPINAIAVIGCTTYFADGRRRFERLTSALALILYVTATNSSRTVIGGQLQDYLEHIHVKVAEYARITGVSPSANAADSWVPLLKIEPDHKFFKLLGEKLLHGGEMINCHSIQNFSHLRKYMYAVVTTERVRVQYFFFASAVTGVVCVVSIVMEVFVRPLQDGPPGVPVTANLCTLDIAFVVVFLLAIFQDAVNLNIVLGDATRFVLESWRENILMHRLRLRSGQDDTEHEQTEASLDYICGFVNKRQLPIGFCGIRMTRTLLQGIKGSAGAALLTAMVTVLFKYGSLFLDLFHEKE